jgi:glutathione S-transferase
MSLHLYYAPMSSSSRVAWVLEELGLPYEKTKLNLAEKEQKRPEYLKLNPNGKVPLLVIDGRPIYESLAQILYLGETYGVEKGLFPAPGLERAEAFKWLAWSYVTMGESMTRYFRNVGDRFPVEERNTAAAESAKKELLEQLHILEQGLAGKEYLLGAFSLVDAGAAGFCIFMQMRLGFDLAAWPNVASWVGRCMQRPALGRAMMG